jgi:hypothetical protein
MLRGGSNGARVRVFFGEDLSDVDLLLSRYAM